MGSSGDSRSAWWKNVSTARAAGRPAVSPPERTR